MRKIGIYVFLIFSLIVFLPILIVRSYSNNIYNISPVVNINVYNKSKELIVEMDLEEYVKGVVAAEMPALFELEALKAQAVASRTFAYKKIIQEKEDVHKGADVCSDHKHCQEWKEKQLILNNWDKDKGLNWDKISKAVDETRGEIILYKNEVILPLFHSNSGGKTESSAELWSCIDIPYLQSVESEEGEKSEKYISKIILDIQEFKDCLTKEIPGINFSQNKDIFSDITDVIKNESGRVRELVIAGKKIKGDKFREIYSLKSTNFKIINIGDGKIQIETLGSGHGLGMSQIGANLMAQRGENYKAILKHYYKNTEINSIKK